MENIKKRAKKIVDANGEMPIAHLDTLLEMSDKLDSVNETIKNKPEVQKVQLEGISLVTIKGDKGDKGDEPSDQRLEEIITPLIPEPIQGEKGDSYILTEKDKKEIAKSIEVPVVEKVIEKTETIIEKPITIDKTITKEVAKYETAEKIIEKINSKKNSIALDTIDSLGNILNDIASKQTIGGGTTPRFVDIYQDGVSKQQSASRINFIGATVVGNGSGADVTITGGGSGGHIIQDEGVSLPARSKLNFIGASVTATDNAGADSTDVTITSGGGSGDVVGPASSTDNAVARYDATTGKLIQNSVVTIGDTGVIDGGIGLGLGKASSGFRREDILLDATYIQGTVVESDDAFRPTLGSYVTGDTFLRATFLVNGTLEMGSGAAAPDVNLYHDSANVLKTDDSFVAVGTVTGSNLSGTNTGDNAVNTLYSGLAASKEDVANKSTSTSLGTSNTLYPTQNAVKVYTDSAISSATVGLLDDRGNYDASTNLYPATGGSGTAGAVLKGDLWTISVAGTLGGNAVTIGDVVRALVDTPAQTASNWAIGENNFGYVAENSANKATSFATVNNTLYPSVQAVNTEMGTRDTANRARANHTGTQLASTISDFASTVLSTVLTGISFVTGTAVTAADSILVAIGKLQAQNTTQDSAIALNTAKVTNATHTGEVTGATTLTVDKTAITNKTNVVAAVGDSILISDVSDTDNLKKVTVQSIIDLASGGSTTKGYKDQTPAQAPYGTITGTVNGSNTVFTVAQGAYTTGTLTVYLDGQKMTMGAGADWTETTPASGTFTFVVAPATGRVISAEYEKNITVSSQIAGQATVNFGASTQEDSIARVTVNTASALTASIIMISPSGQSTADHDPDDYQWDNITGYASNIVNGVSFDIIGVAPNGSWGDYSFNYVIQ